MKDFPWSDIITASALHFVIDLAGRMLGPTTETQRWPPGSWLGLGPLVVLNRWVSSAYGSYGSEGKAQSLSIFEHLCFFPHVSRYLFLVFGIKAFKSSPWAILIRAFSNWRCSRPHRTITLLKPHIVAERSVAPGYPSHSDIFSHSSIQCLISSWISHYHIVFNYFNDFMLYYS